MQVARTRMDEYRTLLADDFQKLEAALGNSFTNELKGRAADQLMRVDFPDFRDCALDLLVADLPVGDRVKLQLAAKTGGYVRPWNRERGAFAR